MTCGRVGLASKCAAPVARTRPVPRRTVPFTPIGAPDVPTPRRRPDPAPARAWPTVTAAVRRAVASATPASIDFGDSAAALWSAEAASAKVATELRPLELAGNGWDTV